LAMDSIAGRETLVVEWTYSENSAPSWKMWLDIKTAVILKLQEFDKNGSGALTRERVVNTVLFNPAMDHSLFTLPSYMQQNGIPTEVESQPVVIESSQTSDKEAGELYFFLQPRQAGGHIQLVRVSGTCVFDSNCPPMQIVNVPFAFNFTINALSWSPD